MKVGWYVHHHGAGHRTRAMVVGRELLTRGVEVTLLGSALQGDAARSATLTSVRLAMDAPLPEPVTEAAADVTVHGRMHWAPLRHRGYRERMGTIARWVQVHEPDVMVVDVSCEVAVLVRLMGIPVVVVAQPGARTDTAHAAAYDSASAILAPWPGWATEQLWRTTRASGCEDGPAPRVVAVGGISRHTAPSVNPAASVGSDPERGHRPRGVVLAGSEGFDDEALPDVIVAAVPDVDWTVVGGRVWVPDVDRHLDRADVVVTHAGQNAIADVAARQVPAVVLPQGRPFDEQRHLGAVLHNAGIAQVVPAEDVSGAHWPELVRRARATGGQAWCAWESEGAASRAASVVEVVASG